MVQFEKSLRMAADETANDKNITELYNDKSWLLGFRKVGKKRIASKFSGLDVLFNCREFRNGKIEDKDITSAIPVTRSSKRANKKNNIYFLGK